MSKHTPGPWIVEDSRKLKRKALRQNLLMVVAENGGMPGLIVNQGAITSTDEANGRLIAAAQDLLEALEAMLVMMDAGPKPKKLDDALTWRQNDEKARGMAAAAIKKARGEA